MRGVDRPGRRWLRHHRHRLLQLGGLPPIGRLQSRHQFRRGLQHRVGGGMGRNQAAIHMNLAAFYQSRRHARAHRAHKQALKHRRAPSGARLGEHAVMGNLLLKAVAQKPEIIQPLRQHPHQLPLAGNILEEQQEHQFEDDGGIHRHVAVRTAGVFHLLPHKAEIHRGGHPAQGMIGTHPVIQIDVVTEEFLLRLLLAHHMPSLDSCRPPGIQSKMIWATRP